MSVKICELSLKIINKDKSLKTKKSLLENENFELKEDQKTREEQSY